MLYSKKVREDSESSMAMPRMSPAPGQGNPTGDYQIQRGDTLTRIASKRLPPNASPAELQAMIAQIAKDNGISDPNRISAGAKLKLPPNAGMGPAPGAAPSQAAGAPSPMPSAPPPIPSAPLSPTGMRGTATPSSIPMPMPSTGGGMPGPMPSITPPTADQITNKPGGFSFKEDPFSSAPAPGSGAPYQPSSQEDSMAFMQQLKMKGDTPTLQMIATQSDNPEFRKYAEFLLSGPSGQKLLGSKQEGPVELPPPGRSGFKNTYRE